MSKKTEGPFIVVYDDQQGLCVPMVWDDECEGAVCGGVSAGDSVALFSTRVSARKAIDISAKWAMLRKSQGKAPNCDFLPEFRKNVKVVPCTQRP